MLKRKFYSNVMSKVKKIRKKSSKSFIYICLYSFKSMSMKFILFKEVGEVFTLG